MQQRVICSKEQYRSLAGWRMAGNNLFTSYRTDNSSINTIIRVLLLHIDEPCSACPECGINLGPAGLLSCLSFFSYLCCSAIPTSRVTIFMFLHARLAGPKITLYFPHLYICASPLIMCAIIMSHTLLPCDLTLVDFDNLDDCFV